MWDKRERCVCACMCFVCEERAKRERAEHWTEEKKRKKEGQETRDNPKLPMTRLVSLETAASWLLLSPADLVTGFLFLSGGDQGERRTVFFFAAAADGVWFSQSCEPGWVWRMGSIDCSFFLYLVSSSA